MRDGKAFPNFPYKIYREGNKVNHSSILRLWSSSCLWKSQPRSSCEALSKHKIDKYVRSVCVQLHKIQSEQYEMYLREHYSPFKLPLIVKKGLKKKGWVPLSPLHSCIILFLCLWFLFEPGGGVFWTALYLFCQFSSAAWPLWSSILGDEVLVLSFHFSVFLVYLLHLFLRVFLSFWVTSAFTEQYIIIKMSCERAKTANTGIKN